MTFFFNSFLREIGGIAHTALFYDYNSLTHYAFYATILFIFELYTWFIYGHCLMPSLDTLLSESCPYRQIMMKIYKMILETIHLH